MSLSAKLRMILAAAPNIWAERFAIRLLLSPKKIRDEWYSAGYRFPWERDGTVI